MNQPARTELLVAPRALSAVDRVLDFLWRKLGAWLMLAVTCFVYLVGLVYCVLAGGVLAALIELPFGRTVDLLIGMSATVVIGWVIAVALTAKDVRTWSRSAQAALASDMGPVASRLANDVFRHLAWPVYGFTFPAMCVVIAMVAELRGAKLIAAGLMVVGLITVAVMLALFAFQLGLRGVLRGIGGNPLISPRGGRFQWRLLGAFALLVVIAASAGVWFGASHSESGAYLLQRTVAAALVIGGIFSPVVFLMTHSVARPLQDLIEGTERLKHADFAEPVPVLSADEFGVLAGSFNEAMEGLADRARLAAEVRVSRARIVAAADDSRKRIERNIHDGAQQRLVALALDLRMLEERASGDLAPDLRRAGEDVKAALAELRELARGLHPSILTTDGLDPAVEQLASRASIPVAVDIAEARFPEAVETACYFTVAEALANVAKYAQASEASVRIEQSDGNVRLQVSDNGVGGAEPSAGSGLTGLLDRIAALDGTLAVDSPVGVGTTLTVELPLPAEAT